MKKIKSTLLMLVTFVFAFSITLPLSVEAEEASNIVSILVPGYDSGYIKDALDKGIADFNEQEGIEVEIMPVGWDELNSKIVQLAQAGESPDILLIGGRSLRQFANEGIIRPLDEYITEEFVEPRDEAVFNTANVNGKQYGVPMAFSARALYYRSDLLDKAPTNWDELYDAALKLKEEHDMYGFFVPIDGAGTSIEILSLFFQNGGRMTDEEGNFTVNSAENVETLEYLKTFADKELIPSVLESPREKQIQMFTNGDLGMFISGPWEHEELENNKEEYPYAVAPLPVGVEPGVNIATDSYVITEGAKNPDGAWKFIEFMGQEDYQRSVSEFKNWFPILEAEKEDERFQTEFMEAFTQTIPYGQPDPHVPNWDEFQREVTLAFQEALTGKKDPQTALDEAQERLTRE